MTLVVLRAFETHSFQVFFQRVIRIGICLWSEGEDTRFDAVAGMFPTPESSHVGQPAECRLECEVDLRGGQAVQLSQQHAGSGNRGEFRSKRR